MGAAWFLDAGNTWEDLDARDAPGTALSARIGSEDVRYGYGFGLRYPTPFGPVRLDIGVPLKRNGRRQFHWIGAHVLTCQTPACGHAQRRAAAAMVLWFLIRPIVPNQVSRQLTENLLQHDLRLS
jgi:hypothetical protein